VRDRLPFVFEDLGEQQVKNITRPVRVLPSANRPAGLDNGTAVIARQAVLGGSAVPEYDR
jgi:hypothetical protein